MFKKIIAFLFVLVLIFSSLSACSLDRQTSASGTPKHNPALDGLTGKFKTSSYKETLNPELETVCFIGNSLTTHGNLAELFEYLVDLNGLGIEVTIKADGGYSLNQHLAELKSGDYANLLENTETVVIQGHGENESDTNSIIKEIMALFKPETKFYYLLTQFDLPYTKGVITSRPCQVEKELSDIKNLKIIPEGYVYEALVNNGYTTLQLQASATEGHPNRFYGYIAALTSYAVIFDKPIEGFEYDFLDKRTMNNFIFSATETDKDKVVADVQRIITEVLAEYVE